MTSLKVPKKAPSDIAYSVGKAILNLIPGGGAVAEIFSAFISSPIESRRDIWMQELVNAFERLETQQEGIIQKLLNDEEFKTLLINASIYASKTHLAEKINRLKNALLNSINSPFSFDIQQIYLQFIDELTPSHVMILKFIDRNENYLQYANEYEKVYSIMKKMSDDISEQFFLNVEITSFRFLVTDLESKGLLFISSEMRDIKNGLVAGSYLATGINKNDTNLHIQATPFGKNFLLFIESDL